MPDIFLYKLSTEKKFSFVQEIEKRYFLKRNEQHILFGGPMNIRKHWKSILLSSTALFWASCGSDSESSTAPQVPESSAAISSSETAEPASSDATHSSSEIGSNTESSSDAVQSSSSGETGAFKLASDPNVTCKMTCSSPTTPMQLPTEHRPTTR